MRNCKRHTSGIKMNIDFVKLGNIGQLLQSAAKDKLSAEVKIAKQNQDSPAGNILKQQ